MEILVYLVGNWCCIGAAIIVILHYWKNGNNKFGNPKRSCDSGTGSPSCMISRDLIILLTVGAWVRIYWSASPPAMWTEEPLPIQVLSILDLFCSAACWTTAAVISWVKRESSISSGGLKRSNSDDEVDHLVQSGELQDHISTKQGQLDWHAITKWYHLMIVGAALSFLATFCLPTLWTEGAWPFVDFTVVFNMLCDGLAIIPQLVLVANSKQAATSEVSHFVGLLSLGRLLRMLFWGWIISHPLSGHSVWTFVVPDTLHTILMADYLYHWVRKLKKDRLDPLIHSMMKMDVV